MMTPADLDALFRRYVSSRSAPLLDEIFRQTAPEILRRARRLGADQALAEDLLQETFLCVLEGADGFRADGHCVPYLMGIVHRRTRRALTACRRVAGRPVISHLSDGEPALVDHCTNPMDAARTKETLCRVHEALAACPPNYREPLRAFLVDGRSPAEIAQRAGVQPGAMRVRIHRGLRMLRDRLPGFSLVWIWTMMRTGDATAATVSSSTTATRSWIGSAVLAVVAATVFISGWLTVAWFVREPGGDPPATVSMFGTAEWTRAPEPDRDSGMGHPAALTREAAQSVLAPGDAKPRASQAHVQILFRHADGTPARHIGACLTEIGGEADFHSMRVVSDSDGGVPFLADTPRRYRLTSDRGTQRELQVDEAGPQRFVVELRPGRDVRGVVLDSQGHPLTNAGVWVSDGPRHPFAGQVVTRTAPDGTFELRAMSEGSTVAAIHPEFGPSLLSRIGAEGDLALTCRGEGAQLRGSVFGVDGEPLANAVVLVGDFPRAEVLARGRGMLEWVPQRRIVTDLHGAFDVQGLPPEVQQVLVRHPTAGSCNVRVDLGVGDVTRGFELSGGVQVTGRLAGQEGEPLAGAYVRAQGLQRHDWASAYTDDQGAYRLEGLNPGRLELTVTADGFDECCRILTLAAGDRHRWDVEVERRIPWTVWVTDEDGRPVDGRLIQSSPGVARSGTDARGTPTDLGECVVESFDADRDAFWIHLDHELVPRSASLDVDAYDADERLIPLVVALDETPDAWISGRIDTSLPLAGTSLVLSAEGRQFALDGVIDADSGEFRAGPFLAGVVQVALQGTNGVFPPMLLGRYDLGSGERLDLGEVHANAGRVHYHCRRTDGRRITSIAGTFEAEGGFSVTLRGPDAVQALLPGRYRFSAWGPDFVAVTRDVVVEAGEDLSLEVVLSHAENSRVWGRLPHALHATAPLEVHVTLLEQQSGFRQSSIVTAASDGLFPLNGVFVSGSYSLTAWSDQKSYRARFDCRPVRDSSRPLVVRLASLDATASERAADSAR